MQVAQRLEFDTDEHRQIYEFVERNGAVTRETLAGELSMDRGRVDEVVSSLTADDVLDERDGMLRIDIETGAEMEYETDELTFTVRPATQTDLAGLVSTMRQIAEEDTYLVAETVVDLLDQEEVVFRKNDIKSRVFFVATVADEVVGWVHLHSPNYEKLAHTAELTMGVLAEYRGHGIGSHLMERGLQWAESNGYEKVYQSLPATNQDAVRFLEEHRWETESIRKAHYKIDDKYVAEQMMAVMLEQPLRAA